MFLILWTILTVLFIISASENRTLVEPYSVVYGKNNLIAYSVNSTSLVIDNCFKQTSLTDDFQSPNVTLRFKHVIINECLPEKLIKKFKVINIDFEFIETVNLILHLKKPLSLMPAESYFQDLKIQHLTIENFSKERTILQATPNFFMFLSNLSTLYVKGLEIPPLSEDLRLANLTLTDGSFLTKWGNCAHLERFHISSYSRSDFPKWPQKCAKLTYLDINNLLPNAVLHVTEKMIEAAPNLRTLKINNCRLFDLPIEMLNCATHLVHLDLSDNNLYDDRFGNFPSIKTLETLDLSKNPILGESGLGSLVVKLPALKALLLRDQNDIYNFCDGGNINIKTNLIIPLQNSSLEYLDFGSTPTDINCIEDTHFSKLKRVIIYQPRGSFEPLKMPLTDAGHMEIDFDPSTLFRIRFSEADYETLRTENSTNTRRNLTILLNYIRCDVCANAWLVRALKDFPHIMSIPGLRCNDQNGNYVLEEPVERMECDKTDGDGCVYKRNWSDMTVIAECSEWFWNETHTPNKTAFEYPLYGLNVSGLKLTTFQSKWPDSQWIDLRHNRLSHGTAEQASALFVGGRRVWLADNLLICDCNNRPLLDAIQHHREQVKDYDQLNCVETGQPVNSVSTDVLCQVAKTVSLSAAGALILLTGLVAILYRGYKEQIHVFLFSKGWCLRCLHNPDSDDKPYDAFISFAHEDQEYVMNTLLPGLEQGPEQFRVCVHYRDWHVGDWIPAQIMRSVQLSKRTLIVLSRSFVASTWSTFEFRYSISNADEDPNAKVLVLVKDDVLDMKLDMEIRGYLTYNTYLRCDDPWFWEKLRYGMPHRVKSKTARNRELEGVRGQELYMENINVAITFPDEE